VWLYVLHSRYGFQSLTMDSLLVKQSLSANNDPQ
jgi:hypothetical protein